MIYGSPEKIRQAMRPVKDVIEEAMHNHLKAVLALMSPEQRTAFDNVWKIYPETPHQIRVAIGTCHYMLRDDPAVVAALKQASKETP